MDSGVEFKDDDVTSALDSVVVNCQATFDKGCRPNNSLACNRFGERLTVDTCRERTNVSLIPMHICTSIYT